MSIHGEQQNQMECRDSGKHTSGHRNKEALGKSEKTLILLWIITVGEAVIALPYLSRGVSAWLDGGILMSKDTMVGFSTLFFTVCFGILAYLEYRKIQSLRE